MTELDVIDLLCRQRCSVAFQMMVALGQRNPIFDQPGGDYDFVVIIPRRQAEAKPDDRIEFRTRIKFGAPNEVAPP